METRHNSSHGNIPFRPLTLGPYEGTVLRRDDGSFIVQSVQTLQPYVPRYTHALMHWATHRPHDTFLAQRNEHGQWIKLSYIEALQKIQPLAQALLNRGLNAERPLLVLSENSLQHALITLAALHVGIPCASISPAYSLLSPSADRVKHAVDLLTPGLVFAQSASAYAQAIEAALPTHTELVFVEGKHPTRPSSNFEAFLGTPVTSDVAKAHASVRADTIAKFLFTSGSTRLPKAVVNTHGMLCSNMQMHVQCYPHFEDEPPVLVDWMPWHHTAAGNNNFGVVLFRGGTMYIDEGKPTADGMEQTLNNLREVESTLYYTVPKGLDMLAHAMQNDTVLRDRFFKRMRLIFPCGAALSSSTKRAMDELAIAACGARIPMTMALGMTETAPFALSAHLPDWQAGIIGLPAPGLEVKLAPVADKLEVRYRGPNITPGYWRQPELTREAFDEEGFFCSGDAARFIDPVQPESGLAFDGRIAEDFKLVSGTWVNVGALRLQVIGAGAPYIHDVVITGHDREYLGMLVFLLPAAAELSPSLSKQATLADMASDAHVKHWTRQLLDRLAAQATGSSNRIARAILLSEPASMALCEMTDKGSINQRTTLRTRAKLVERLYAPEPPDDVLIAQTHVDAPASNAQLA